MDEWGFVRPVYERWAAGDFGGSDWAHPEIEFVAADGPTPGTWRGLDGMARAWSEILSAWEDLRTEPEEFQLLDDGRLLVLTRNSGRGKASGLELGEMQTRGANLLTREGRVVRKLVAYWNRDRAFSDLGLAGRGR